MLVAFFFLWWGWSHAPVPQAFFRGCGANEIKRFFVPLSPKVTKSGLRLFFAAFHFMPRDQSRGTELEIQNSFPLNGYKTEILKSARGGLGSENRKKISLKK